MATHYKFNLSAYIQELLVMCWRGCAGRDLNEETLAVNNGRWQSGESSRVQERCG